VIKFEQGAHLLIDWDFHADLGECPELPFRNRLYLRRPADRVADMLIFSDNDLCTLEITIAVARARFNLEYASW
jgi:hypothetical protein